MDDFKEIDMKEWIKEVGTMRKRMSDSLINNDMINDDPLGFSLLREMKDKGILLNDEQIMELYNKFTDNNDEILDEYLDDFDFEDLEEYFEDEDIDEDEYDTEYDEDEDSINDEDEDSTEDAE
jgi:hypothetical protein